MDLLELPFQFVRVPNLKLKFPNIPQPGPMVVFALVFASYFLVLSGIIYDVIVEPPSIGSVQDEATGAVKPVVFLQYRVNGQYIIEGLSAGFLFCLGGLGFIVLDIANRKVTSATNRYVLVLFGLLCIVITYNLSLVFLRMKVPGYLRS
eukprot:TRINITY_DN83342_c0_g1_i1.p1 TRINITY_DN83342_c0_g1~~TRINITY_DN83342_c0_g1_i1.p1  ORF type:complete len:149 (-),score=30.77 TRINITY_DN83342_c0_g1_i1:56-502(-)